MFYLLFCYLDFILFIYFWDGWIMNDYHINFLFPSKYNKSLVGDNLISLLWTYKSDLFYYLQTKSGHKCLILKIDVWFSKCAIYKFDLEN